MRASTPASDSPVRHPALHRPLSRRALQYLFLIAAVVLVVNALVGERGLIETMRARQQTQQLVRSIEALRQENAALREQARRLKEDPGAIEEIARRDLGLIREGEVVFIIKDVPSPDTRKPAR